MNVIPLRDGGSYWQEEDGTFWRMELIIPYNPMATDFTLSEFANIRDIKYSFHTLIKLKIVTVMIPGCAIGSMIFQKVFMGGQPSIAAASSNALERLLKKVSP